MYVSLKRAACALAGLASLWAAPAAAQNMLLGIDCNAPPVWHCPDRECLSAVVTQQGTATEMKTRRPYFLDCPTGYKPGDKVSILLSLHGGGSYGNWQRNYFPVMDVKDKHKLVVITPNSPIRAWSEADDEHLRNLVDAVVGAVGKANVERFILAGHSQGGMTSNRIICSDYFKDKVDVRISLSGGRIGPVTPSGRGFGVGGVPVWRSGEPGAAGPPANRPPPQPAAGPPGGACDYSFIFTTGEYETIPAATSPLADKYGCAARREEPEVLDPKPGYVWDSSRQDPGTDGWGHYPRSGRAKVYVYPGCKDGRVVADVVRLFKGHTEGLEPNVTDKLVTLAMSARGGKIARGTWNPPPPPPPAPAPFGGPPASPAPRR